MPARKEPDTVAAYLAALPADRREAVDAIRAVVNANIGPEFEEGMQYGMPAWYLPHEAYPLGYHCDPEQPLPFASVASQKGHIGIYLFCVSFDPADKEAFAEEWRRAGKKLDMGAGCVRVKSLEEVPLKVLGRAIKRAKARKVIQDYESALPASARKQRLKLAARLGLAVDADSRTVPPRRKQA